ncbi:MAG: PKD domain-containing protein [Thermoplasmata archaeon]|nr:PKD domain-containing protein [Thermoplasmata archaeon]
MTDRARRNLRLLAVALGVVALMAIPGGWTMGGPAAAPHVPVVAHPAPAPASQVTSAARPSVFQCPMPPLPYLNVGVFFPPNPSLLNQLCGGPLAQDSVHGTFSSAESGSGERFTEQVYLPTAGSPGQTFAYNDFYLGMVVAGDPGSIYRQSYAQLVFTPTQTGANSSVTWAIHAAVWAMHNDTAGGNCTNALVFTWNNSFWCIMDMIQNGSGFAGPGSISGGTFYNITFDGVKGNLTKGMWIWANDSTNPTSANNVSLLLNATNTGGPVFEPFYNSSCPDACFLNWSLGSFGLGIGWDLCPISAPLFAPCDSYNQTTWDGAPTVGFGIPNFFTNGTAGYAGDYSIFAPMSASAQCSSSAVVSVASCPDSNSGGGTGFYPFFTWNGSQLNFGDEFPWTVEDFGGFYTEYIQTGPYQHDFTPTFIDKVVNTSRSGYLRPLAAMNVSASISDMGQVTGVNMTYSLNSASPTTVAMSRISGTSQRGVYNATIPSGANGFLNFTIQVTARSGAVVLGTTYHVYRGPLPTFLVTVDTYPPSCTNATVNGTHAASGTVLSLTPGVYPISSTSCYPHNFERYTTTPGLRVIPSSGAFGNLSVSQSGTVTAIWKYFRPNVTVDYVSSPAGCGSATINGTSVPAGTIVSLQFGIPVSLSSPPSGCASMSFAGWTVVGNLTVLGSTLTAGGNGTLVANYISSISGSTIAFLTQPTGCGAILYRGVGYTNGMTLTVNSTAYPIASAACSHWGFQSFQTTGGATVANGNLTVTSSGSVTEVNYVLTEVRILASPANCTILFDGVPYGNDSVIVVQNNSTHILSQNFCPGHYAFGMTPTTGLHLFGSVLTVNDSGNLYATWLPGRAPSSFLEFETDPGTACNSISFLNFTWYNTNYSNVAPNSSGPISAQACPNYGFVRWQPSGGVVIHRGYAYVNSSGAILAVFRPVASVSIQTTPTGCGTVQLNGVGYPNNGSASLTEDVGYPILPVACAHYQFQAWSDTVGAVIANGDIFLTSNAILTATFIPTLYNVTVRIDPATCGSLYLGGLSETNGTNLTLPYGNYSVRPAPCVGDVVESVAGTGNVSVVGNRVTIGGNGSLVATYAPIPPTVILSGPTSSAEGDAILFSATVAVPVPPFSYNYTWTFGDGTNVTTPANFTQHTFARTGTYHVEVVVHDPFGRNASANQTVSVVTASNAGTFGVPSTTFVFLGLLAIAAVALVVVALWRRRSPPAAHEDDSPEPSEAPEPSLDAPGQPIPIEGPAPYDEQA